MALGLAQPPTEEEKGHCPACACTQTVVYLRGAESEWDVRAVGSSRTSFAPGLILRCMRCGHGFRYKPPSYRELVQAYRSMDVAVYAHEESRRRQTALRHVRLLNRWAPSGGRLLDVGCASGLFLSEALFQGWQGVGIEPNTLLAGKAGERLGPENIVNRTLEEADLPDGTFDAIALWDVLEHVADPAGFLRKCRRLLRPSGTILLKVPNLNSLTARAMGGRWPVLLPEHLNYFTRRSLGAFGECAGLRPVGFGRSPVTFSLEYVSLRLSQHGIPGVETIHRRLLGSRLGRLAIPLYLGEIYCFLRPKITAAGRR